MMGANVEQSPSVTRLGLERTPEAVEVSLAVSPPLNATQQWQAANLVILSSGHVARMRTDTKHGIEPSVATEVVIRGMVERNNQAFEKVMRAAGDLTAWLFTVHSDGTTTERAGLPREAIDTAAARTWR